VRIGTWNIGSLTCKFREVLDTMIRWCVIFFLRSRDEMEGAKVKRGGRYRLQTLVHREIRQPRMT
jgi:hypothetical protein